MIDTALDIGCFRRMKHIITEQIPFDTIEHGAINCFQLYQFVESEKREADWLEISSLRYKKNLGAIKEWHPRYVGADPRMPGLVVDFGDYYRLIDGKHRLKKLLYNQCTHMLCHILTKSEALKQYSSV